MTSKITNIFHQNIIHKNYMYINTVVSYLKSCNANFLRESSVYSQKFSRLLAKIIRIIFFILKFSKQQEFAEFAFVI